MSYQVSARKYRPTTLNDVYGQEVLTATLRSALARNTVAHAYIFTGMRGVGKTTTARILARCLLCTAHSAPSPEPCGVCDACIACLHGNHPDVYEMDAASHTGVQDIRQLMETVAYAPLQGRYRVYIIDEVHMLSSSAFNALLKTLEEPPAHVVFLLATTEIHKVPATVRSRCQVFQLRRLTPEELVEHLMRVAAQEQLVLDPEAALMLAAAAEGSVRDSLSLLDQARAHSVEGSITYASVRLLLGLTTYAPLLQLLEALLQYDGVRVITQVRALLATGEDPSAILQGLTTCAHRAALYLALQAIDPLWGLSEHEAQCLQHLCANTPASRFMYAWDLFQQAMVTMRITQDAAGLLEMTLLKALHAISLPSLEELM